MRYEIEGQILTDIADSIREKTGKSALIKAEDMAEEIDGISGGENVKGFELYTADGGGNVRKEHGSLDNNYFVCFFHDNMSDYFSLNGSQITFPINEPGKFAARIKAATLSVANTSGVEVNDAILAGGSQFSVNHSDNGSYISIIGGWVGYPANGTIYEQEVNGMENSITLNNTHSTLLLFIGASGGNLNADVNTVEINGVEYQINNAGAYYESVYSVYGAIIIKNNNDSEIMVRFPVICNNYVSIIGID